MRTSFKIIKKKNNERNKKEGPYNLGRWDRQESRQRMPETQGITTFLSELRGASSKPLAGRGVVVLGEECDEEGKAWPQCRRLSWPCCPPATTKTETDTPSKVVVRALLAPSR